MAQTIKLKRSATAGKVPATTDLELGEIAINTYDGKVFIKKDDGSESIVEVTSASGGGELIKDGVGYRINGLSNDTLGTNAVNLAVGGIASDYASFTEGYQTEARDDYAHAEGNATLASGKGSHAEGYYTEASGNYSHAEGYKTKATNDYGSHAEGNYTTASGVSSHAEGYKTESGGIYSHAEGNVTTAEGYGSHSEGGLTKASGYYSHAEGYFTIAQNDHMHVEGKYNVGTATDTIHETGIGADGDKKNAFEIYIDGKVVAPELTTTLIDDTNTSNKVLVTKEWVQANTGGGGVSRTVEKLTGDGSTTSFTLTNTYVVGSETLVDVYVDGLLKIEGSSEDYTLSNGDTLDFTTAPSNGSAIIVKILS